PCGSTAPKWGCDARIAARVEWTSEGQLRIAAPRSCGRCAALSRESTPHTRCGATGTINLHENTEKAGRAHCPFRLSCRIDWNAAYSWESETWTSPLTVRTLYFSVFTTTGIDAGSPV